MSEVSAGFRLPLVHHLVEQGLRNPLPSVPPEMPASDHDLVRAAGGEPELAQPPPHPSRETDPDSSQRIVEMGPIEFLMQRVEPGENRLVAGTRLRRPRGLRPGRMRVNGKLGQDALRPSRPCRRPSGRAHSAIATITWSGAAA